MMGNRPAAQCECIRAHQQIQMVRNPVEWQKSMDLMENQDMPWLIEPNQAIPWSIEPNQAIPWSIEPNQAKSMVDTTKPSHSVVDRTKLSHFYGLDKLISEPFSQAAFPVGVPSGLCCIKNNGISKLLFLMTYMLQTHPVDTGLNGL